MVDSSHALSIKINCFECYVKNYDTQGNPLRVLFSAPGITMAVIVLTIARVKAVVICLFYILNHILAGNLILFSII